jgi:hypothetical protein
MRSKIEEKNMAIELRKQGKSLDEITRIIETVSKTSVSCWVRPVILTNEQMLRLKPKGRNGKYFTDLRKKYREEGRQKAKENDIGHAIGCMLYWAEGWKSKNVVYCKSVKPRHL